MKIPTRKISLITGLAVLCVMASSFTYAKDVKEETRRLLAETYMASGQNEKAIKLYRDIIEQDPEDIKSRVALAQILSWEARYDDSIKEYKDALKIDPDSAEALSGMAQVYYWSGDLDSSERIYRQVLEMDPENKAANDSLAEILVWRKKYPEAIERFSNSLDESSGDREKMIYGRALLYSGQYLQAESVFEKMIKKDPGDEEAQVYLADTYAYSRRYAQAETLYEKILRGDDDPKIRRKLADVLSWDKKYKRSILLYDGILDEKYDKGTALQKARVLGWSKKYGEALREYKDILKKYPNDNAVILEMNAKQAYWNGKPERAIEDYRGLVAYDPGNSEALFDLSQIYSHQEMWEQAVCTYQRLVLQDPAHFRAKEGLEKARLVSEHISLQADYRFFEASSPSRDVDILKHQMLSRAKIPVTPKFLIDAGYMFAGRRFADYHDLQENEGEIKLTYSAKPGFQAGGYYKVLGYNKELNKLMHMFGADLGVRFLDQGVYSFFYDKERLENNSTVIRGYYYRNKFKNRIDLDLNSRVKAGIDYMYASYSDGNYLNEPGADVLWYLSFDPKRLTVKYRYFYKQFNEKVGQYFSPKGFSTHAIFVNWRHYLNKEEIFFGANDIYYDLGYHVSVDSTYIVEHQFIWKVHYDVTKRLSIDISGSVMGSSAGVYEESEVMAGAKYYF